MAHRSDQDLKGLFRVHDGKIVASCIAYPHGWFERIWSSWRQVVQILILRDRHGSVVIAAITSCTNTSNPSVMLGAGLLAKQRAIEAGLTVAPPYIKTSLSPGSGVVSYYLQERGYREMCGDQFN